MSSSDRRASAPSRHVNGQADADLNERKEQRRREGSLANEQRWQESLETSIIVVRDVEEMTAGFAVHGVGVMPLQTTLRAREVDLVGAHHGLRQSNKQ